MSNLSVEEFRCKLFDDSPREGAAYFRDVTTSSRTIFPPPIVFPLACSEIGSTRFTGDDPRMIFRPVGVNSKDMVLVDSLMAFRAKRDEIIGIVIRWINRVHSSISSILMMDMQSFFRSALDASVFVPLKYFISDVGRDCTSQLAYRFAKKISLTKPESYRVSFLCVGHFLSRFFRNNFHIWPPFIVHNTTVYNQMQGYI